MPRLPTENNSRMSFRISPQDKALVMRAVAYTDNDLTSFALPVLVQAAKSVIDNCERVKLSERDSLSVLDALENPPIFNAKLLKAARDLPDLS